MPKYRMSPQQEMNFYNFLSGDIPLTAVARYDMNSYKFNIDDWTDYYKEKNMGQISMDRYREIKKSEGIVASWQDTQRGLVERDRTAQVERAKVEEQETSRYSTLATMYFDALERGDFASAQSLSALNPQLRKHWNSRVSNRQQTYFVKQMLGEDASTDYMTKAERTLFYNRFVKDNKDVEDKKYKEYLIYMYLYGCAVHAILNGLLHAKGTSMTDAQYDAFLHRVYERASDIFTSSDFGKSFEVKKDGIPLHSGENIVLKNNIEAAKKIRDILHNDLKINMSDIYISKDELPDGYVVTAEGAGDNDHKVAQDVVSKAWFDSLEGRNTTLGADQGRLWIGTTVGGQQ